jgi:hypothetical protein
MDKCLEARSVIRQVNWDCEVVTNIADRNLGCRQRVVSGLNWVFSLVKEAIILEDDCVPNPSFFAYCETLLKFYRDDERVMEISGCNFLKRRGSAAQYSYYFSRYYHTWGWATWRRAWKYYDEKVSTWPEFKCSQTWAGLFHDDRERMFWSHVYDQIAQGHLETSWDYQWQFARWRRNALAAVPSVNLVSNIGFGPEATTTTLEYDIRARLPVHEIGEIHHPSSVVRDATADNYRFNRIELLKPSLVWKIRTKLTKVWRGFSTAAC